MSSLRAVVSAVSLGSKSWSALSSPVLRNGSVFLVKKPVLTCEANFSSTASFSSSDKDTISDQSASSGGDWQQTSLKDSDKTSIKTAASEDQQVSSAKDNFEEIISASRRTFSSSFGRDCHYRLIQWQKKLQQAEKEGKKIDLEDILTDTFPDVVEFSLTPLALPEVRLSVLKILLTQQSDNEHSRRVLQSTTQDALQLPIGIVAEIVRLLSLASPTDLRLECQCALVSTVVNRRWYEVGANHLVFFMFQMDKLFDVKAVAQQLRRKSKSSETKKKDSDSEKNGVGKKETDEAAADSLVSVNMESRAITLANELKVKDLARVVSLLSRWNSRNEPLLNACLHRLSLADLSLFTPAQLGGLLQAMAALSLHHPVLLENTTKQLSSALAASGPSSSQVCGILQSLALLRWTDGGEQGAAGSNLVRSCLSYLSDRQDTVSVREAAGVLTSLASLSVMPSSDAERAIVSDFARQVLEGKSPWWGKIQCVWCLAVLRCLDSDVLHKVLEPQFVQYVLQQVKESSTPDSALASANKLAQINMASRLEGEGYTGPVLTEEQLALCTQTTSLRSNQKAAKTTLAITLRKFVDLATYVDLNPSLPNGCSADALMCANHEGEVRPLGTKEHPGSLGNKTEPTLSLAIQYIPFSGVNSPGEIPTGQYQMAGRHLSMLGYTPVQIFYSDLKPSLSMLERVSNIKARIKAAVQSPSPTSASQSASSPSTSTGDAAGPSLTSTSSTSEEVTEDQAPKPS